METNTSTIGAQSTDLSTYVSSHIKDPTSIFEYAKSKGLSTTSIAQDLGYKESEVRDYFESHGLKSSDLEEHTSTSNNSPSSTNSGTTSTLIPPTILSGDASSTNSLLQNTVIGGLSSNPTTSNAQVSIGDFKGHNDREDHEHTNGADHDHTLNSSYLSEETHHEVNDKSTTPMLSLIGIGYDAHGYSVLISN